MFICATSRAIGLKSALQLNIEIVEMVFLHMRNQSSDHVIFIISIKNKIYFDVIT